MQASKNHSSEDHSNNLTRTVASQETKSVPAARSSIQLTHKRVKTNDVTRRYVTAGHGPAVLCMRGWPQNHCEFVPCHGAACRQLSFIAPDLRAWAGCRSTMSRPFNPASARGFV